MCEPSYSIIPAEVLIRAKERLIREAGTRGREVAGLFFLVSGIMNVVDIWTDGKLISYARENGVPGSSLLVPYASLLLILGGLSFLFNWRPKLGIFCLIGFLIPTDYFMHAFWKLLPGSEQVSQFQKFIDNLGLVGLLLWTLLVPDLRRETSRSSEIKRPFPMGEGGKDLEQDRRTDSRPAA